MGSVGIRSYLARANSHASRRTSHRVTSHLLSNQQILREGPLGVDPLSIAAESRARCHLWNFFGLVLVRAFCPNGFVFVHHDAQAAGRNMNRLSPRRTQMHLDAPLGEIPERLVPEAAQIKIRA